MSIFGIAARDPSAGRLSRLCALFRCGNGLSAALLTACTMGTAADPGQLSSATSGSGGAGSSGSGGISGTTGAAAGSGGLTSGSISGAASGAASGAHSPATVAPSVTLASTGRLARLSHTQLVNTYRDLLGLADTSAADTTLTPDAVVGYDNEADSLFVADQMWANVQEVAELYAHSVATTPTLLAKLVPVGAPTDAAGKAKAFIGNLGLLAYRRPLLATEATDYLTLFNQGPTLIGGTDSFASGAELVLQAFLQSPFFLYRTELSTQVVGDRIPLSDYEVAAKLAYALTNTMPDAALLAAAAQGQVANPTGLASQANRLLATPAATTAVEHFHFQTYRMGTYDGITKDPLVYPQFTPAVGPAMRQENLLFLDWVFNSGKSVADIYTSPVSFVNNLLAPTYGLKGSFTSAFQQVTLDPSQRSGLLTQLGFLASVATTTTISTILRGVFVNQRVLCVVLPPPSPLAKPLPAIMAGETDRQLVDGFTGAGTCAQGCHNTLINPPGFAFENYDSLGSYRTLDQGKTINAADTYAFTAPTGPLSFNNAIDFEKDVAKSQQAHSCYVQNWASYLYGRSVADATTGALLSADAPTVGYLADQSLYNGLSVKDIILSIATNATFLSRAPGVN